MTMHREEFTYKHNEANKYEYMGKSITVPNGHAYLLQVYCGWASARPSGIAIGKTNNSQNIFVYEPIDGVAVYDTPAIILEPGTYYIFGKRATVPGVANNHAVIYFDIVL